MSAAHLTQVVLIPVGLGLLGFVEPCSIGSTLIFIKHMEGKDRVGKLTEVSIFAMTRAVFFGLLGVSAVMVGGAFLRFQTAGWILLGIIYSVIGVRYLSGRATILTTSARPIASRLSSASGSVGLGLFFGLNIPACAAPLLLVLFGSATVRGAAGATLLSGFVSLGLFGLALSLPLLVAVLVAPTRRALDWIIGFSARVPVWTGLILMVLGLWSIGFALVAWFAKS